MMQLPVESRIYFRSQLKTDVFCILELIALLNWLLISLQGERQGSEVMKKRLTEFLWLMKRNAVEFSCSTSAEVKPQHINSTKMPPMKSSLKILGKFLIPLIASISLT